MAVESWGGAYSPSIITKVMDGGASYSAESRDGLQTEREFVLPDKIRRMTAEEEEQYIEVEGETSSSKVSKKKKRKDKKKQKSKEKKRLKDEKKKAKSDARIAQKKAALKLKQEQKRKEKQANMNRILGIEEQVKEEEKQEEEEEEEEEAEAAEEEEEDDKERDGMDMLMSNAPSGGGDESAPPTEETPTEEVKQIENPEEAQNDAFSMGIDAGITGDRDTPPDTTGGATSTKHRLKKQQPKQYGGRPEAKHSISQKQVAATGRQGYLAKEQARDERIETTRRKELSLQLDERKRQELIAQALKQQEETIERRHQAEMLQKEDRHATQMIEAKNNLIRQHKQETANMQRAQTMRMKEEKLKLFEEMDTMRQGMKKPSSTRRPPQRQRGGNNGHSGNRTQVRRPMEKEPHKYQTKAAVSSSESDSSSDGGSSSSSSSSDEFSDEDSEEEEVNEEDRLERLTYLNPSTVYDPMLAPVVGNQRCRGDQLLPPALQMGRQTIPIEQDGKDDKDDKDGKDDAKDVVEVDHATTIRNIRAQLLTSKTIGNNRKKFQKHVRELHRGLNKSDVVKDGWLPDSIIVGTMKNVFGLKKEDTERLIVAVSHG